MGSSRTASSEASTRCDLVPGTFARPPPVASRSYEPPWVPRSIEFRGWNPEYFLRNVQGISEVQAKEVMGELAEMMPVELKQKINWELSQDQGPWPRKIKVSLRFNGDTHLVYMIETMKRMRGHGEETVQHQWIHRQDQPGIWPENYSVQEGYCHVLQSL